VFLWKVRLSVRELCSVGCEARKQEALQLPYVRVESGGSCVLVESEAVGQEAVFLWKVRLWVRKLCSCGK
jgi:hypothetical protein